MAKGDSTTGQGTILNVSDEVTEWESEDGKIHLWFVKGDFEFEGEPCEFSLSTNNQSYVNDNIARMEGLIGKDETFRVEDRGEFSGMQQYKLLDYPGKPGGGGSGSGSNRSSSSNRGGKGGDWETAPERAWRQKLMLWESCLKSLVSITTPKPSDDVALVIAQLSEQADALYDSALGKVGPYPVAAPAETPAGETPKAKTDERKEMTDALMAHFRTKSKLQAAWEDAFGGEAPEVAGMTDGELGRLVDEIGQ